MMARKQGRIITIGSIAGCFGRNDGVIYSVAKAGVHEYTRCLAVQLRPEGRSGAGSVGARSSDGASNYSGASPVAAATIATA